MSMMVQVKKSKQVCKFGIEGEANIYGAAQLKQDLLDALDKNQELEIDLSRVSEMDTAGFQLLYMAKREANRQNKVLRLVAHSAATLEVMDQFDAAAFFGDPVVIPASQTKKARGKAS